MKCMCLYVCMYIYLFISPFMSFFFWRNEFVRKNCTRVKSVQKLLPFALLYLKALHEYASVSTSLVRHSHFVAAAAAAIVCLIHGIVFLYAYFGFKNNPCLSAQTHTYPNPIHALGYDATRIQRLHALL